MAFRVDSLIITTSSFQSDPCQNLGCRYRYSDVAMFNLRRTTFSRNLSAPPKASYDLIDRADSWIPKNVQPQVHSPAWVFTRKRVTAHTVHKPGTGEQRAFFSESETGKKANAVSGELECRQVPLTRRLPAFSHWGQLFCWLGVHKRAIGIGPLPASPAAPHSSLAAPGPVALTGAKAASGPARHAVDAQAATLLHLFQPLLFFRCDGVIGFLFPQARHAGLHRFLPFGALFRGQ